MFWPLGYPFQRGHLAKEIVPRLRRAAQQDPAADVRDDPRLGADLPATTDAQVPRHRGLAADLDEILEHGRSGDPYLGHDDAAASQLNIVADLDQVIEARAGANDRVPRRSPVDRGIRADFHVVPHNDASKLRDAQETGLGEAKLKPS